MNVLATLASLLALAVLGSELPVDENQFLKQTIDFSPPEERQLDAQWLRPPETAYPFPAAAIEPVNGVLKITVDGEDTDFYWRNVGATTLPGAPVERQLREQGLRSFIVDTDIHAPLDDEASHAYELFAQRADNLLASVPDARFIVRVWMLNVAADFSRKHPDALLTGPTGDTGWGWAYKTTKTRPNALNEWRRYCGEYLYRLIHRIGQSPYASHTVGFYVGALNSGEWWYYKGKTDPGWDYSATRLAAYRRFLSIKYTGGTGWVASLGESMPGLPTLEERGQRPILPYTPVADYLQTLNLPVTNAACYFGDIIKAATSGNSLAGMEIGAGFECFPNNGTIYLSHLLDSPNIDFLGGPAGYSRRGPGRAPLHRNASATLAQHGMLWFNEGDYRTHLAYGTASGRAGEPTADPWETTQVLRREFGRAIVKNYPTYLMDFGWDWFHDPGIVEEVGRLNRLARAVSTTGLRRTPEIAVVVDQESQLYANYFANPTRMRRRVLEQVGCDYAFYELRDFLALDHRAGYKLVIFLNIRALSASERQGIDRLKKEGRTLLFMHDPGVLHLNQRDPDVEAELSRLTGLNLVTGRPPTGQVRAAPEVYQAVFGRQPDDPFVLGRLDYPRRLTRLTREVSLSDTADGLVIGNAMAGIACLDTDAQCLAVDEGGHCRLASRDYGSWRSVYAASCLMTAETLRDIARLAGCHLYADGGAIIYAADELIVVHAEGTGERRINLKKAQTVIDFFTGEVLATGTTHVQLDMRAGETRILYLGDAKAWREQLARAQAEAVAERSVFKEQHPAPLVSSHHYNWFQALPPSAYYELRKKWLEKPPTWAGPYRLTALTPGAWLLAGPYANTPETLQRLDRLIADGLRPSLQEVPESADKTFVAQHADRFLGLIEPLPAVPLDEHVMGWRPLCFPSPWIQDGMLRLARGQAVVLACYLEAEEAQQVKLQISTAGEEAAWLNGRRLHGSGAAEDVWLKAGRNLLIVRVSRGEQPAGVAARVMAVDRPRESPADIRVWLTPE